MASTTSTSTAAAETVPQIAIPENVVAENADTSTQNSPLPSDQVSTVHCLKNFKNFINTQKNGLKAFYTDEALKDLSDAAAAMANKLCEMGCGKETSKQLSLLCLYDIVMLIGMYHATSPCLKYAN